MQRSQAQSLPSTVRRGLVLALLIPGFATLSPVAAQNGGPAAPANQVGRLTTMGNGQVRRLYQYDVLGRTTVTEHRMNGGIYLLTTAYGYPQNPTTTDGAGAVPLATTFPDGETVYFGYDAAGQEVAVSSAPPGTFPPQPIVHDLRRNARGQTTQVVYGNGLVTSHLYNDAGDLRLRETVTGNGVQDYLYTFDAQDNLTEIDDGVVGSFSAAYGYDSLDQLTSMTSGGASYGYQYDSLGNLTQKEGAVQSYGGGSRGPHALAAAAGVTYSYDANGNVSSTSAGLTLAWNAEDMAVQASVGGVVLNQKSFLGQELWKKVEGGVTTLYLPSLRIENGQLRKFFGAFAERSPDGSLKFYHPDHLGSSTVVTDQQQVVVRRAAYLPYGGDRGVAGGSFTPRYQFNFKEKEATGFYDYGARLYNPATGRWLSPDGSVQDGLNRYAYVANNPIRYTDPTGKGGEDGVWARYYDNVSAYHYRFFEGSHKPGEGWEIVPAEHTYTDDIGRKTTLHRNGHFDAVYPYTKGASFWSGFISALTSPHDLFAMALGVETSNMRLLRQSAEANRKTAFVGGLVGSLVAGRLATPGGSLPETQIFGLRNGGNVYNIGRKAAVDALSLPGERTLNLPNWTLAKNDHFIWNIIEERGHVNLLSPRVYENLWDAGMSRWTVTSRELMMLEHNGFSQVGTTLIPR
jgi:RHS repeat-associated protein